MKIIWVFLMPFTLMAQTSASFESQVFVSGSGYSLKYRVLWPENYQANKKYPLVLFLHGAGERGADNEKQLTHGSKLFLDPAFRKKHEAIVIFPQCPEEVYWASMTIDRSSYPIKTDFIYAKEMTPPLAAAMDVVVELVKKKQADKNRLYIMGLSMGAMGTFEVLSRHPRWFAAAAPICGGGNVDLAQKYARKVPLWIFHGDADAVVPVDFSRRLYQRLTNLGARVKYTEYPGVNHNSWDNAFTEPDLLEWMFQQHK